MVRLPLHWTLLASLRLYVYLSLQQGHQVNIINAARCPDMSFSLTNPGLLRYTGTKQQRCTGPYCTPVNRLCHMHVTHVYTFVGTANLVSNLELALQSQHSKLPTELEGLQQKFASWLQDVATQNPCPHCFLWWLGKAKCIALQCLHDQHKKTQNM